MEHISPSSLDSLPQRIVFLKAFLNFTSDDAAALHSAKDVVAPLIPTVLDAVYTKLLSFDITAASFVPRNTDYKGDTAKNPQELTLDHPQVAFRKDFLRAYLVKLVTADYDSDKTWEYLDRVGLIHTGARVRATKAELRVEYIHIAALLGHVVDILLSAVLSHPTLDNDTRAAVLRAFNKVIWIQNDLFSRHYIS